MALHSRCTNLLHDLASLPHNSISGVVQTAAQGSGRRNGSLAIHFTWKPDWASVRTLLPEIEAALAPFEVRPHWGKLFAMGPAAVQEGYARLPDFVRLARELDPAGKFTNAFLDRFVMND